MALPPKEEIFEIELALWEMMIEALRLQLPKDDVRRAWEFVYHTEWEVAFDDLVFQLHGKPHNVSKQIEFLFGKFYSGSVETLDQWIARIKANA